MILNEVAWGWDRALVDDQTATEIVPTPEYVAPARPPEARPAGNPIIQMMEEYLKSTGEQREFIQNKRRELYQKFDRPTADEMLEDLENMISRHRAEQSRGPR